MSETTIRVDASRATALEAAVSAGGAASVQAAVESAVDAWLLEQAVKTASDGVLQKLWMEGVNSGEAGGVDFDALKADARRLLGAR